MRSSRRLDTKHAADPTAVELSNPGKLPPRIVAGCVVSHDSGDQRFKADVPPELIFAGVVRRVWQWLVAKEHRPMRVLWLETYAHSLVDPQGPYAQFALRTVEDWLELLAAHQTPQHRRTRAGAN